VGPRRFLLYQQILNILRELETQTDAWSAEFIRQFITEADADALQALRAAGLTAGLGQTVNPVSVDVLTGSLTRFLSGARSSVAHFATKIFRSTALENEFPQLAFKAQRQVAVGLAAGEATSQIRGKIAELLRPQFRDGLVSVVGHGGRRFTFPMNYYAGMVASATKRQARTVATITRAREANHDLVRVSANPSKTGDWCDAYRGRVFSISGAHPLYPALDSLPNGGPPFHPWCRHSLQIFVPQFHSEHEQREAAKVNPEFLMRPNEENPNRLVRAWWSAKRSGAV
jgi:hypothetical protein